MLEPDIKGQIGPAWVYQIATEIARLDELGCFAAPSVHKAIYYWCLALEIEGLHRPHINIINPYFVRMIWTEGKRTAITDIRPAKFTIETNHKGYHVEGKFQNLAWVQGSRDVMRWMYPDIAGGTSSQQILKEFPR
jgi:hypothetical protein